MGINDTLKAAFENLERWEQAQHDSSGNGATENAAGDDPAGTEPQQATPSVAPRADMSAPELSVKGLDQKAVLVSVKRRMYSPYKVDEAESRAYGAGKVSKHLFAGKDNRVKKTIAAFTEVYSFVNDNTVPWTTGVRMLNINHYFDFSSGLRQLIDRAEDAVDDLCAHWQEEVQADLDRLRQVAAAKGNPSLADPDDYPDVHDLRERFGIEVRYMPVPTTGDFRVEISDEDKASLQRQLEEAQSHAARHVVEQMLEPMQRAAEKLSVPIGEDGSIFRDSLIDNMVEVADRMERVNVVDDPQLAERIKDLKSIVSTYADNKDVLRSSQSAREKAASQINDLVGKMSGFA